jgi:hypothetical protein
LEVWGYAYLSATIVGVSRMERPDSWLDKWAVLAGAAVGIGSTYLFTSPYMQEYSEIGFSASNKEYLVSFRYKF